MSFALHSPGLPKHRLWLTALTLLVALAHLALLAGVPRWVVEIGGTPEATKSFATRTIAPEPAPRPAPPATPTAVPAVKPAPAKTPAQAKPPVDVPIPLPPQAQSAGSADSGVVGTATSTDIPGHSASADATAPDPAVATPGTPGSTDSPQTPPQPPAEPPRKLVVPASIRLSYDVVGVVTYAYTGGSELLWLNQGSTYSARLAITKFGFNLRTWASKGDLGEQGLAPLRFGDKTRSEVAAHFQRDKGIVSFSANTPEAPLQAGAQDYLSSFFQLAALLAGEPERYPAGTQIAFQVVNARSAENWVFRVDGEESTALPDGPRKAIKLTREHDVKYDTKVELWLAPEQAYVPIRIRLSQDNGDFAELLWRSSQKPE